jgi:TadE-like protein
MIRRRLGLLATGRATATIEVAIGLPAILMLLFGIVEFGRLLWTHQILMHAADMTARCYSISSPLCTGTNTPASYAVSVASSDGITLDATGVPTPTAPSCTTTTGGSVNYYTITINYTFTSPVSALLPLPSALSVSSQYGC